MNELLEVYKQRREVQSKYTYLFLAVAASAIALSLKRTTGLKITDSMILLALAVLCWGVSFFCGCRYLRCVDSALSANLQQLILGKMHAAITANIQELKKEMKKYSDRGASYST
ncbi:hypothetical protein LCGC14_1816650, partial [marine sediment metagenome]